jgi:hypothetical protein
VVWAYIRGGVGGGLDGPCWADPLCRPGRVPPDRPHFRPRPGLQYQAVPARPTVLSCQAVLGPGQNRSGLVPPVQPGPFGHLYDQVIMWARVAIVGSLLGFWWIIVYA